MTRKITSRAFGLALGFLGLCWVSEVFPNAAEPDLVIAGTLNPGQHQTYQTESFQVPEGIDRLTVMFDYDRRNRTTIDLGLADPERFRGWSGGNKSTFILTESFATSSYLPGPLPAGTWQLLLGVPNIRNGTSADYQAQIFFEQGAAAFSRPFASEPLDHRAGWYRGDLHLHSGHSDGRCVAQSGDRVPCPLDRTVASAAERGLDFIAVTEHNTRSHHQTLMELQAAYDRMVILPGRELTTFQGHANVFGTTGFIDFRLPADEMLQAANSVGGLVSINHPALPSDERCMGCGWRAEVDYGRIAAVEVVSGGAYAASDKHVHGQLSGISFWEELLNDGYRVTAIAGSDNHDPDLASSEPSAVGFPTTVVYARSLSQPDLMRGIRNGRVFIDVEGSGDRLLEFESQSGTAVARAGEALTLATGALVEIRLSISGVKGPVPLLIRDGQRLDATPQVRYEADSTIAVYRLTGGDRPGWIRAEVADADGRVLLLSNPVYLLPAEN